MRTPVYGVVVATLASLGSGLPDLPLGAVPLTAQEAGPPLTLGGLLRAGLRLEPEEAERGDGFEIFDARLSLEGEIGIVFDYFLQGAFEEPAVSVSGEDPPLRLELLDARLTLPFRPEANLSIGQFKAPFGGETLLPKAEIRFLERALASRAIAPDRQVGIEFHGETTEGRLAYRAGVFNGNGRALENDDDSFLYAARVQYNTVGPIEFYEDLVVQIGANLAFSSDGEVRLGPALDGMVEGGDELPAGVDFAAWEGDRFLAGFDLHLSYRGWELNGEYLRADLDPAGDLADDLEAWGGYVEGVYGFQGAVEGTVRYDFLDPVTGPDRKFLILGLNLFPGFHAKFGLQYAVGVDGSPAAPEIADDQFILLAQVSF